MRTHQLLMRLLLAIGLAHGLSPLGAEEWRIAGQSGGPVTAVAVQDNVAWLAVGHRVHAYDVSDPAAPRELGSTAAFGDFVSDIELAGSRAYVTAGSSGLHLLDIADPAAISELGSWDSPGSAEGAALNGSLLYLADGPFGVAVVDVSNPAAPSRLGAAFESHFAFDVAVDGERIYVAGAGAGVLAADVSEAGAPRELGTVDTPGFARDLAISGQLLYVADQWGGVRIMQLTESVPREVASIAVQSWAFDVAVIESVLVVAAGSGGLRTFDVSSPEQPHSLGVWDVPWNLSWKIAASQTRAFLGVRTQGVTILDLESPAGPKHRGAISPTTTAQAVAAEGNIIYTATTSQGLRAVDFTDPARPRERGQGTSDLVGWAVVTEAGRAYACEGSVPQHFLNTYDVSNPDQRRLLASAPIPGGHCRDLALSANRLYLPDEFGLEIWDVTNASRPVYLGSFNLAGGGVDGTAGVEAVGVRGTTAFIDGVAGIYAIDVSNPTSPRLQGEWQNDPPWQVSDVAVDGNFVYVLSGIPAPALIVVDASDPTQLRKVSELVIPAAGQRVIVRDGTAYVAVGASGLAVVDVRDPDRPILQSRIALPGFADELAFWGDRIVVASAEGGLHVLERSAAPPQAANVRFETRAAFYADVRRHPSNVDPEPIGFPPASSPRRGPISLGVTRIVTSTADAGGGTLRAALGSAQAGDTITFDPAVFPPADPATIRLQTVLPAVTRDNLTIDASNAGVVLDGSGMSLANSKGLEIRSAGNTIRGMQITGFNVGISLEGKGGNTIGGDRSIGSGPIGQGNRISRNKRAGIAVSRPDGNRIIGNLIGTDLTGREGLGGQLIGVDIFADKETLSGSDIVGGADARDANVIAGNEGAEVYLHNARGNIVTGNFLGTDPSGTMRVGTSPHGIATSFAAGNLISNNVIAGEQIVVFLTDTGSHCNLVTNNRINVGVDGGFLTHNTYVAGAAAWESFNAIVANTMRDGINVDTIKGNAAETFILGNTIDRGPLPQNPPGARAGVNIGAGWRTFVGGTGPDDGNRISGNYLGVWILSPGIDRTFLLGNVIRDNAVAIDLGEASSSVIQGNVVSGNRTAVTVRAPTNTLRRNAIHSNDAALVFSNVDVAPPVIHEVTLTTVRGASCPGCLVEIFSDQGSQGGWYEGEARADEAGAFVFAASSPIRGPNVTATATDSGGTTSMFSAPMARPPQGPRRRSVRK